MSIYRGANMWKLTLTGGLRSDRDHGRILQGADRRRVPNGEQSVLHLRRRCQPGLPRPPRARRPLGKRGRPHRQCQHAELRIGGRRGLGVQQQQRPLLRHRRRRDRGVRHRPRPQRRAGQWCGSAGAMTSRRISTSASSGRGIRRASPSMSRTTTSSSWIHKTERPSTRRARPACSFGRSASPRRTRSTRRGSRYARSSANASVKSFYIVDRGLDNDSNPNENDGKMYEMSVGARPNTAPVVNAGGDQTVQFSTVNLSGP